MIVELAVCGTLLPHFIHYFTFILRFNFVKKFKYVFYENRSEKLCSSSPSAQNKSY